MNSIISLLLQTNWFKDMPDDEYREIAKDVTRISLFGFVNFNSLAFWSIK